MLRVYSTVEIEPISEEEYQKMLEEDKNADFVTPMSEVLKQAEEERKFLKRCKELYKGMEVWQR